MEKNADDAQRGLIANRDFLDAVVMCGRILGPLFLERPNTDDCKTVMKALLAQPLVESWPFGESEQLAEADRKITEGYAGARTPSGMQDLTDEYNRLFIGPAPKPAPPWGSVYLDRDCVVFGMSLLEMRQWMRENGVRSLYPEKEPEDHIGRMFELMATLAEERPELLPEFLRDHLLTWAPHYLGEFEDSTESAYFKGLAELADATLEDLRDLLELDVPKKKFYR